MSYYAVTVSASGSTLTTTLYLKQIYLQSIPTSYTTLALTASLYNAGTVVCQLSQQVPTSFTTCPTISGLSGTCTSVSCQGVPAGASGTDYVSTQFSICPASNPNCGIGDSLLSELINLPASPSSTFTSSVTTSSATNSALPTSTEQLQTTSDAAFTSIASSSLAKSNTVPTSIGNASVNGIIIGNANNSVSGLSANAIVGIVAGIVVFAGLTFAFVQLRKKNSAPPSDLELFAAGNGSSMVPEHYRESSFAEDEKGLSHKHTLTSKSEIQSTSTFLDRYYMPDSEESANANLAENSEGRSFDAHTVQQVQSTETPISSVQAEETVTNQQQSAIIQQQLQLQLQQQQIEIVRQEQAIQAAHLEQMRQLHSQIEQLQSIQLQAASAQPPTIPFSQQQFQYPGFYDQNGNYVYYNTREQSATYP